MTLDRVPRSRVRLVAGIDLLGSDELVIVAFVIAGIIGIAVGIPLGTWLGTLR